MTDVRTLVENITDLPTLPDVVARLNRMVRDPNTSAGDINDVISRDVSFSARILKLVNSPYYGFSRRITSITYAVVILGFNTVRNLALSAFIFDAFKKRSGGSFDLKAFWRHSVGAAISSASVAQAVDATQEEDAFMAGLLHGVGKVVMGQFLAEDMERVMERIRATDCRFTDAEREELDYTHAELGGLLLERWNLPEAIVDAVRYHERPAESTVAPDLCAMVHMGVILTRSLCFGSAGDRRVPILDPVAWERLGLTWDAVEGLMEKTSGEIGRADEFFSLT